MTASPERIAAPTTPATIELAPRCAAACIPLGGAAAANGALTKSMFERAFSIAGLSPDAVASRSSCVKNSRASAAFANVLKSGNGNAYVTLGVPSAEMTVLSRMPATSRFSASR